MTQGSLEKILPDVYNHKKKTDNSPLISDYYAGNEWYATLNSHNAFSTDFEIQ